MKPNPKATHPLATAESRAAYLLRSGVVEVNCCGSWIAPTNAAKFFHMMTCKGMGDSASYTQPAEQG